MLSAATQANGTAAVSTRVIIARANCGPSAPSSRCRSLRDRMIGLADHGGEGHVLWDLSGRQSLRRASPGFRQVKLPIDEGVALIRHVGGKDTDLAVGDLARR